MAASILRSQRALSAWLNPRAGRGCAHALMAEARWGASSLWPLDGWRQHALGAPLIVSLTSSPRKFSTLALTLKTLLTQTVRPDSVVLWLTPEEHSQLPGEVRSLRGVTIRHAPDLGAYKKIIPALERSQDAFIAIADDDVYYPPDWLDRLTAAFEPRRREIPCHRALRIVRTRAGVATSLHWPEYDHPAASQVTFAIGGGGVLYPPFSLHRDVLNRDLFRRLSPTSVDLWLFWMAQRSGWRFCKIGGRRRLPSWPGRAHASAMDVSDLDVQFVALQHHFGWPRLDTERTPGPFEPEQTTRLRERRRALLKLTLQPPLCSPRHAGGARRDNAVLERHDERDVERAGDASAGRARSLP